MKWVALLAFIALIPILQSMLRSNPRNAPYIWGLLGLLPFLSYSLHIVIAPISWVEWTGYIIGTQVSPIESIACAILLNRRRGSATYAFKWLWVAYILALLLSVLWATEPKAAFFAVWQAARMLLIGAAVATIAADERGPKALITGMTLGLAINAVVAVEQRLSGALQTPALFSHQNLVGMSSHFVAFPALAMWLADRRYKIGLLAVVSAATLAILGASRGTLGFAALGYVLVFSLSLVRRPTPQKWTMAGFGFLALAAAVPLALGSLDRRFEVNPVDVGTYDERAAFEKAARLMMADHPMGVGANHYVYMANVKGYAERAGVVWNQGSRAAQVHNAYLLIGAETGYIGLACFLALLFTPIVYAGHMAWKYRKDPRGDILVGLMTTLIIVALHSQYEWVFVTYFTQWLFAINTGIIAGTVLRLRRPAPKRAARQVQPGPDDAMPVVSPAG